MHAAYQPAVERWVLATQLVTLISTRGACIEGRATHDRHTAFAGLCYLFALRLAVSQLVFETCTIHRQTASLMSDWGLDRCTLHNQTASLMSDWMVDSQPSPAVILTGDWHPELGRGHCQPLPLRLHQG